jgi:Tol biopolymer transport system component
VKITCQRAAAAAAVIAALALLGGCDHKIVGSADQTAPHVEFSSPSDGATVSGVGFFVDVTATDDVGVQRVEVSAAGGTPVVLTGAPFRVHVVTFATTQGSSLDIQAKAYDAAGNSDSKTITVTVAQRAFMNITAGYSQDDSNPTWSPDGTRIAFQSNRGGGDLNLWVMNADGSSPVQLTTDTNSDRHPAWSPDGTEIAFDSNRSGSYDVWVMSLATGEAAAQDLTFGNNDDIEPAWSPDGGTIYFASNRGTAGNYDIWRVNVADSMATQVTSFPETERAPAVSSDGTMLAFASTLDFATPHVFTMTIGSTDVAPLTGAIGVTEADPAWAPGGSVVVFSHSTGANSDLYLKPVDPNVPAAQATFSSGVEGDGGAAWSPLGDAVAYQSDRDGNLDIWTVQ